MLGPPGAGKGTQAKLLAKELDIPQISTGDLFRENIQSATPIGLKAKNFIQTGALVPDEVVLDMFFDRIKKNDCKHGYVLDGIPRTLYQADVIAEKIVPDVNFHVLCLNVEDATLIDRAEGRLVCRNCGKIYHARNSRPKESGVCDSCNGELYRRPDDAPEVVKERLRVYHEQTKPLIAYYKERGYLTAFEGDAPPDLVHAKLMRYFLDKEVSH